MYYILKGEPTPIQFLKGVGPARAKAFHKIEIFSDVDLLFYFPRSYINRTSILTIKQIYAKLLKDNFFIQDFDNSNVKEEVTLLCKVIDKKLKSSRGNKKFLVVTIKDFSGDTANFVYWQYPEYYDKIFERGRYYIAYGSPELDYHNELTFHHPEVEKFDSFEEIELQKGTTLPIYPMSSSLKTAKINNKVLRKIIKDCLPQTLLKVEDFLPDKIILEYGFLNIQDALRNIHFPTNVEEVEKIKNKFKFEEAFLYEFLLIHHRNNFQEQWVAPIFDKNNGFLKKFHSTLPFELTNDQKKVITQIFTDLKSGKPMNRLLQGDVGSGKTIVAVFSMLLAKINGYQSAIMAPTEILAEQHYLNITNLLYDYPISIELITGGQPARERKLISEKIRTGAVDIIVGTHALFEGGIEFNKLGLVIIDEQHRFGVAQRSKLREIARKSLPEKYVPHFLVMSATPIPRTLAMTLYGDLDVSTIKELPKGRKPIVTKIVFEENLEEMYNFIRQQLRAGNQAYFVYPLIEKSEKLEVKSAIEHWEILQKNIFPEFSCGLLHGRMKSIEKESVMKDFKAGKYNILVSTTVIEVGIDVPNANIIVIENSERFGLSQLHQLRGRVGRGSSKSYCFLVVNNKYNFNKTNSLFADTNERSVLARLKAMEQTTDGFVIAEIDLKLRGPGDILGVQQSGLPPFKFINLATDGELISKAREIANTIKKTDPNFRFYPKIKVILEKFSKEKKYFGIG
ncbi:MAG: ATP-dependent DNA helicase RecG [Ignavibacteria bacterium]|nr:ATP-dependent DNA helicase RecG [Ignavibacteria bacterium]